MSSTQEEVIRNSRRMLLGGCFCLPLLWLLHLAYHLPMLKQPGYHPIQGNLKKHLYLAGSGAFFWTCIFIGWWVTFTYLRNSLDVTGDRLSVVIPKGK
ncbi:hypothetical protein HMI54_011769 [Coelomomyces lativittatus]|nr:hypothetical protein HMI56_005225 [Coelomomyces lativittatus]KAJ1515727.1 hypothetical protein HMI54_011769 [Coelomomyces lativittatus]KAJ1517512.1 hypothetical protein HMI55_006865 [Coelomomyces lativittatus]